MPRREARSQPSDLERVTLASRLEAMGYSRARASAIAATGNRSAMTAALVAEQRVARKAPRIIRVTIPEPVALPPIVVAPEPVVVPELLVEPGPPPVAVPWLHRVAERQVLGIPVSTHVLPWLARRIG